MPMIFCKKCGAPIALRSSVWGEKIPKEYRSKMKPVSKDGVEKRLCADCEEEQNKKVEKK